MSLSVALAASSEGALTLTATGGDRQVSLAWPNVTDATGYQVENALTAGGPYAVVATGLAASPYVHTGLNNGITNYYVVTATTPTGNVASVEVAAKPWVTVLVRAINCGGGAVWPFSADTNVIGGTPVATTSNINRSAATAPAPEAVYQSGRVGNMEYTLFPFSPSRQYRVRVHWAEIVKPATRSFHINVVNGAAYGNWLTWINLLAVSYAGDYYKAVTRESLFTPNASGQILIKTLQSTGILNGFEIMAYDAPIARVNGYPRSGSVGIDFSATIDAQEFNVARSGTSGGPYTSIATGVTGAAFFDTNVVNGSTYYYKVTAKSNWGETEADEFAVTPGVLCYAINVNGGNLGRFTMDNASYTPVGGTAANTATVPAIPLGTVDPAESATLYRFYRTGAQTNVFGGLIPGEAYLVRLHFNEFVKTAVGARVFHVDVNSDRVLTNLDVFAQAGGNHRALVKDVRALADGTGKLTVKLLAVTDVPVICGFEIRQQSGTMTPPPPIGVAAAGQPYLVALTWQIPTRDLGYTVWRSETAGGPYDVLATNVFGSSYVDDAVANGVTYYYRIVGEVSGVAVAAAQSAEVSAVSNYGATETGLHTQFYKDFTESGVGERLAFSGAAANLQTNWGAGNIGSPLVGDRNAKVVWHGRVMLNRNTTYTFHAKAAGGIRLWVTNYCVINKWNQSLPGEYVSRTFAVPNMTGFYPLHVEYFNTEGNAEAVVEWEAADVAVSREVIPSACLRPLALGDPGEWAFRDVACANVPGYGEASATVPGRIGLYGAGAEGINSHQFACQQVTGPFELTARLGYYASSGYLGVWNYKIGLAIRSSLTGTNGFAYGLLRGWDHTRAVYNDNLGASSVYTSNSVTGTGIPVYYRMRREKVGSVYKISTAYSANGIAWTTNFVSATGFPEPTVYAGMTLGVPESHLYYGYFDNIELRRLRQSGVFMIVR